jgi:hypothetical protein
MRALDDQQKNAKTLADDKFVDWWQRISSDFFEFLSMKWASQ